MIWGFLRPLVWCRSCYGNGGGWGGGDGWGDGYGHGDGDGDGDDEGFGRHGDGYNGDGP